MANANLLTKRQRALAIKVATGLSNKEIAREWSISVNTIKSHLQRAMRLTGVNTRNGLAVYAVRYLLTEDQRSNWLASDRGQKSVAWFRNLQPDDHQILSLLLRQPDLTNEQMAAHLYISSEILKRRLRCLSGQLRVNRRNMRVVLTVRYFMTRAALMPESFVA